MSFPRYEAYRKSGVDWLGEVPRHWQITKLKRLASFCGGGTPDRENVAYWNGDIPWVSPKDMKAELVSGAEELITEEGLANSATSLIPANTVLMVVRSGILKHTIPVAINVTPVALNQDMKALSFRTSEFLPRFFFRWVQGLNDSLLLAWAKQGATVESIEQAYLADSLIVVPPIGEQHVINTFLDRETAKIDALVEEQQRLIELLKEKRQAVISHAVTKGLDPNAPMKDSGVEWIGDVPAHWTLQSLNSISALIQTGPFGSQLHSDDYVEDGVPVINPSHIGDGRLYADTGCSVSEATSIRLSDYRIKPGDIIVGRRGEMGRCAVASAENSRWICGTGSLIVRLAPSAYSPFVALVIRTSRVRETLRLASVGSTMDNLNEKLLSSTRLAVPQIQEQIEIVRFLDSVTGTIDKLVLETESAIALLQERRSALISAAVTGKIDVRGLAPQTAEAA